MKYIFLLLLSLPVVAHAQKITVRGLLKDSVNAPLPSATVLLLNAKDSALVNFAASTTDGSFEIRNVSKQQYLLKVTYVGYKPHMQRLDLTNTSGDFNVGAIVLEGVTNELDEVMITAERAPVTIKKDTIEFNAGSFKTQENALVEDLLKRLPGVEVDNDGTIRAQGQEVRRVTIDGKTFFGTDPKIATRNLPADAIDKVQIFDKKSDQAVFTGIDDGQREKTINLELKEEKRKGAFGSLMAGVGDQDRFQAKANINRFQKQRQISFLGMANNVNQQGFGMEEYLNFTGGAQRMMSGQGGTFRMQFNGNNQSGVPMSFGNRNQGLLSAYAGGVNFNNTFNRKTDLNASYFYNQLRGNVRADLQRINYLPDNSENILNENSRQLSTNHNHRVNTELDHKIDSLNSLKLTTSFSLNTTSMEQHSESETVINEQTMSESSRRTISDGTNTALNTNLLWRHRFAKKGRTLSTNLLFNYSDNDRLGTLDALVTRGGEVQGTPILQRSEQAIQNLSWGGNLSYTEPLGGRKYLELNYNFRENQNDMSRLVFDVVENESNLNDQLSTQYSSVYQYHRGGLNFRMNRSQYNLTVGGSVQQTYLKGILELPQADIRKNYQNFLPVLRFNYEFTTARRISLDYETSVQEPTIQQLQPVVDNSDPLNLYVGNPDLRPAYSQNVRVNFSSFNPASFISLFGFVQASLTDNAITVAQSFSDEGVRLSQPVNVRENKSILGNLSFGMPINVIKSRISVSANARGQQGTVVVNDIETQTVQSTLGGRFRYDFRYNDVFDLSLDADISRQSAVYDSDRERDQLFFNNTYNAEANLNFLKRLRLSGGFEFLVYNNRTTDYRQEVPLLNASLSAFMLKARSGELKFGVHNLLNRNVGYSQVATLNYFERQRSNNLGRYFMVSFTYALNKQLNPLGARPAGGNMIRIMR